MGQKLPTGHGTALREIEPAGQKNPAEQGPLPNDVDAFDKQ
jgi:hypothetical protein